MHRTSLVLFGVLFLPILGCSLDTNGAKPITGGGGQAGNGAGGGASSSSGSSSSGSSSSGSAGVGGVGGMGGAGGMGGMGGAGGAGGMGGAGGQGGGGGGGPTCPVGSTPMVLVEGPEGPYCIDATEVTSLQYSLWLVKLPAPDTQDPLCGWKNSYIPRSSGNSCNSTHYDPITKPNHPVACVDWCDARAFCAGVGKRLCGAFGDQPLGYDEFNDSTKSEWTYACSNKGERNYPYGDDYEEARCVDDPFDGTVNSGNGNAEPVKTATNCKGGSGFSGLFDMSGNVWEWEDSCRSVGNPNDPKDDQCRDRGGSFWDQGGRLSCTSLSIDRRRDSFNKNVGFRCCADPVVLGAP
ncbi:formylglycine-generating enzyme family protein [Polyangium sorediatum]|uniref:SUMF1/EgtB/PvdO family nonheme iron enzyme n=1 Tax=Polyangium sorediatum TaxID=889274 RepID=A0ABT6PA87_9BACT|nr:SUMF1/EgtB/PvdO family nonheme iron enzyme [Polyangium sorediatum]MDI1437546.1 SUMF1/EgtB/PvdO family nonheme iron enzyme [Polyangium sorediatum]